MLIGIIGAPNKGKSTLFSAMTMNEVQIADYPFTTIDPNRGIAYVTRECVERKLGVKCRARNSLCVDGTRMLPINVIDVAGLVEGAHEGRGMGNQFLNDLAAADAFMLVVDASGRTDIQGNPGVGDPVQDVLTVMGELSQWLAGIVKRHMSSIGKSKDGLSALEAALTGLRLGRDTIERAASACNLPTANISWDEADIVRFSSELLRIAKPVAIIANKADAAKGGERVNALREKFGAANVFECSAAIELALRKAAKARTIDYVAGNSSFKVIGSPSAEQKAALGYMQRFMDGRRGTGVQEALNSIVFGLLDNIVVYPVEDENKYTDHFGNVLPDAVLLKRGSTAQDLAAAIHTDLSKGMLYAVDAVRKMRMGREHVLEDNDVVRIVSSVR